MEKINENINIIKESILKNVEAKYIYLFGSYAYGKPNEQSDIDIYAVVPDNIESVTMLYGDIIGDLSDHDKYSVNLLLQKESIFSVRKIENLLEETVVQKGKLLYENKRICK
jgi:predicted nucleotidyltransferase